MEPGIEPEGLSIPVLDRVAAGAFVKAVAPLFEGAPRFLRRLADARPFGSAEVLFARARSIAHSMTEPEQLELIDAHPPLGAAPGSLSSSSYVEQGHGRASQEDGLEPDADPGAVTAQLERLNHAYEAHFGFRYCVFVAGRSPSALLPVMAKALGADRDAEISRALDAVIDIAADRHAKMTAMVSLGAARSTGATDPAGPA